MNESEQLALQVIVKQLLADIQSLKYRVRELENGRGRVTKSLYPNIERVLQRRVE